MCWCSHPTNVCQPDHGCHQQTRSCIKTCEEYPLLSDHGCLCEATVCDSRTDGQVLCKDGKCLPSPNSCEEATTPDTECACDSHTVCTPDQACQDKTCSNKCPVSPFLATDDCFCHGKACNSMHVCHHAKCLYVSTPCNPDNVRDTNCTCNRNTACLDDKICLESKCVAPKPDCMPWPLIATAEGCICTPSTVCQEGLTCDKEKEKCKLPPECKNPRELGHWNDLNLDIQGTNTKYISRDQLTLACHPCHLVKGGEEKTIYSVKCLDSGDWSEDIVGCEKMACARINVDTESVISRGKQFYKNKSS